MNGRERALRALKREPVDRAPIYSNFRNPRAIERLTGLRFDDDPFKATSAAYVKLGIDMTKEIMVPFTKAPPGFRVNPTGYGFMREGPEVGSLDEFIETVELLPVYDELCRDYDYDIKVMGLQEWFGKQQGAVGDATLITGRMGGCFDPS
jgi:hypothetical protein